MLSDRFRADKWNWNSFIWGGSLGALSEVSGRLISFGVSAFIDLSVLCGLLVLPDLPVLFMLSVFICLLGLTGLAFFGGSMDCIGLAVLFAMAAASDFG